MKIFLLKSSLRLTSRAKKKFSAQTRMTLRLKSLPVMYTDSGFKQPLDGYVYLCTQEIVIPQKYTGLITVT